MEKDSGYIRLSRKFFKHYIWQTARTFNGGEAWLDLIQSARFEASEITSRVGECYEVTWGRGQYPASIRFLAKKWQWSEKKVRFFLRSLVRDNMIAMDSSQGVNIITLLNYDQYNPISEGTPWGTPNNASINELDKVGAHLGAQWGTPNTLNSNTLQEVRAHPCDFDTKQGHTKGTNIKEREINILSSSTSIHAEGKIGTVIDKLRQSQIWIDEMCKKFNKSPSELMELISLFESDCICTGEEPETEKDAKRHFFYWLGRQNRQITKTNETVKTNETQRTDKFSGRRGLDPSFNRPEDYSSTL